MGLIVNLTNTNAAHLIGLGLDGKWQVTVVVKASYEWDQHGTPRAVEARPIVEGDEFAADPASSGLLVASDLGPMKPKVDVLLAGVLVFPRPITEIDVLLMVGTRLQKGARVFGDRVWLPGSVADLVPSQVRAVTSVPIAWERSYGGGDVQDPKNYEAANPAGTGVARDPKSLHGKAAPNFEDPDHPAGALLGKTTPIGFGPIAQHWQARVRLAGTYDEAWEKSRRPLPPADFSPAFFNVAPADQQLDGYIPGEEVRLVNMTAASQDHLRLPNFTVPATIVSTDELSETLAEVDTITIEPEARRFSLLARAQASLPSGPESLGRIIIGEMPKGMRKAVELGLKYLWPMRRGKA